MTSNNPNSHLTAKERDSLSFPAKLLLQQNLLVGDVLDFGCGFGSDVSLLAAKGISIKGYDKHYFPQFPTQQFDTILCFYVLNVLLPEEQALVLMEVSQLLKPNGKAYFAVRRDVHHEGFRLHKLHQQLTYQCNVVLNYNSVFKNESCEVYEYQHYNQLKRTLQTDCPFCNPEADRTLLLESATAYALLDKFPVSKGHSLIIPKRHCSNYFELSVKEQTACWLMLNKAKELITQQCQPDGFNVGINIEAAAGQTVPHVHIHLIPRYNGDVLNPRGGVRGVIPERKEY